MKKNSLIIGSLVLAYAFVFFAIDGKINTARGDNYALLIGISKYQDHKYKTLKTPDNDTDALAAILKKQYGFKVTLLNGTVNKSEVIEAFKILSKKLNTDDHLLIYYTGYGEIEKLYDYSWWIPSDAQAEQIQSYIDNAFIKRMLGLLKARHILLITDSAFSKTNFGQAASLPAKIDQTFYSKADAEKSRWVISAGTQHPSKSIKGHGSLAYYLIRALKSNSKKKVSIRELFNQVEGKIKIALGQTPKCLPIKNTGHSGGEFILTLAAPETSQPTPPIAPTEAPRATPKPPEPPTTLLVNVNVDQAELLLDGTKIGNSPFQSIDVNPGEHLLMITKEGYDPFNGRIVVEKGKANVSTIFLNKIKPIVGKLFIKTIPANTTIQFRKDDLTYQEGMELNLGPYEIQLSAKGYEPQTLKINIEPDKDNYIEARLKPLQSIKNSLSMKFLYIAPGTFSMGSPFGERNRGHDETQHSVALKKHFYIQSTEVTIGQWKTFIQDSGYKTEAETGDGTFIWTGSRWLKSDENQWRKPGFTQDDTHPVTCVSWNDAQAFIKWLSKKEQQDYRLPTEAQWEYACRAGTQTAFSTGKCIDTKQANFDGNSIWGSCPRGDSNKATVSVAQYPPNAWGVYDMHGNLWEWCQDWYGIYPKDSTDDPTGPNSGTEKVVRGGAWESYISSCRSANRSRYSPKESYSNIGFRLVLP